MPMSIPAFNSIFRSSLSVELFNLGTASNGLDKWAHFKTSLHSSKRLKFALGFVVAGIMIVSSFAFLSTINEGTNEKAENEADSPTSTIPQFSTNITETQTNETEQDSSSIVQDNTFNAPSEPSSQVLPSRKPPGIVGSAQFINRTTWKAVAEHAWMYFQYAIVNPDTGLPAAGCGFPYFTDWDLGVYVQAIIDAEEVGLIEREGPWGADSRLEKVLTFLENRTLTNDTLPFWFYQAEDGNPASQLANHTGAIADTGRLLAALRNVKTYNNSLETRIEKIATSGMNYSFMLTEVDTLVGSNNIYDYFVASGFAAFWPNKTEVANSIITNIMTAPQIVVNGGVLPVSKISCEPILLSIFELNQPHPKIFQLSRQIYLAHEGWYNFTGNYRAFSEGPTIPGTFAYEWVVLPDGRTWVIQDQTGSDLMISPIIYSKVAFSFLALYNTAYARDVVVYLENSLPEFGNGYCDGMHENGKSKVDITGSNTNGLIISAARYAIDSGDWP